MELRLSCTNPLIYVFLSELNLHSFSVWQIDGMHKTAITPLLAHWSYHSLLLSQRSYVCDFVFKENKVSSSAAKIVIKCYFHQFEMLLKVVMCDVWCSHCCYNSLVPGRFYWNFGKIIFKLILMIGGWAIFKKIALRWMSQDRIDDKSTLVQVMAWCRQATSHYLSQCWPRSVLPYGVTRPQWVNSLVPGSCSCNIKLVHLISKLIKDSYLEHCLWNGPQVNATRPHWLSDY